MCLVHPVSSARMILSTVIATEDALGITELANIDVNSISHKTYFMLKSIFARNIFRNTVVKIVLHNWHPLNWMICRTPLLCFCSKNPTTVYLRWNQVSLVLVQRLCCSPKSVKTSFCVSVRGYNAHVRSMSKADHFKVGVHFYVQVWVFYVVKFILPLTFLIMSLVPIWQCSKCRDCRYFAELHF